MSDVNHLFDVVIPTVGESVARLQWLLAGMRSISYDIRIIIADDGGGFSHDKRSIAELMGCDYVLNDRKPGIPSNLNSALVQCTKPWVLICDDGASIHNAWLDSASSVVRVVNHKRFAGRNVGLCGATHVQDWQLRLAECLDKWTITEWFYRPPEICDAMQRHFREKIHCPHNLDWGTIAALWEAGPRERNDEWPTEVKDFLRYNVDGDPIIADDVEDEVCRAKYLWRDRWSPGRPVKLRVNWSPGAQGLLVNREFLAECGGFTQDAVAYEQWLACQAAQKNWLSLASCGPPFVHMPSLGFTELGEQKIEPVHKDIYVVCQEVFGEADPRKVIRKFVSPDDEANANADLSEATRANIEAT